MSIFNISVLLHLFNPTLCRSPFGFYMDGTYWTNLETFHEWLLFRTERKKELQTSDELIAHWQCDISRAIGEQIKQNDLVQKTLLNSGNIEIDTTLEHPLYPSASRYAGQIYEKYRTDAYFLQGYSPLFYLPPVFQFPNRNGSAIAFRDELDTAYESYVDIFQKWNQQLNGTIRLIYNTYFEQFSSIRRVRDYDSINYVPVFPPIVHLLYKTDEIQLWNELVFERTDHLLSLGIPTHLEIETIRHALLQTLVNRPNQIYLNRTIEDCLDFHRPTDEYTNHKIQSRIAKRYASKYALHVALGKHIYEETLRDDVYHAITHAHFNNQVLSNITTPNHPIEPFDFINATLQELQNVPVYIQDQNIDISIDQNTAMKFLRIYWFDRLRSEEVLLARKDKLSRKKYAISLQKRIAIDHYFAGVKMGIYPFKNHAQQIRLIAEIIACTGEADIYASFSQKESENHEWMKREIPKATQYLATKAKPIKRSLIVNEWKNWSDTYLPESEKYNVQTEISDRLIAIFDQKHDYLFPDSVASYESGLTFEDYMGDVCEYNEWPVTEPKSNTFWNGVGYEVEQTEELPIEYHCKCCSMNQKADEENQHAIWNKPITFFDDMKDEDECNDDLSSNEE